MYRVTSLSHLQIGEFASPGKRGCLDPRYPVSPEVEVLQFRQLREHIFVDSDFLDLVVTEESAKTEFTASSFHPRKVKFRATYSVVV